MSIVDRTTIEYSSGAKRESDKGRLKISELSEHGLACILDEYFDIDIDDLFLDLESDRDVSIYNQPLGNNDLTPEMLRQRYTKWMNRNSKKYGTDNWEKGLPNTRSVDAIFRHLIDYLRGDKSEDHITAIVFNCVAIMQIENMVVNNRLSEEYAVYPLTPVVKEDSENKVLTDN